jgi:AraC-like DNA-binding protein
MMLSRAPRPALRPFVRTLWAIDPAEASAAAAAAREHVLPAGTTHLAIRLSNHPLRVFADPDDTAGRTIGLAIIGGPRSRYYVRDVSQPACSVGAELEPGAAPILFGVPADELAERHTPLEGPWGPAAAAARERLGAARSLAERLDVLEAILAARLPRARGLHPAVAHALGRLHAGAGVGAIVDETGYSQRHFFGLFRSAVGLGPKVYGRVQRFQGALTQIASAPSAADAAAAAGYSDQAHMTREFRAFAGLSPGRYRALRPASPRHVPVR